MTSKKTSRDQLEKVFEDFSKNIEKLRKQKQKLFVEMEKLLQKKQKGKK